MFWVWTILVSWFGGFIFFTHFFLFLSDVVFDIYTTDDTLVSPIFPNSSKIDSYISKYNTFKNEKLTGWVNVGKYKGVSTKFSHIGVNREYEKGSFKSNRLRISVPNTNADGSSIIQKLINLNLVTKQNQEQVSIAKTYKS